MKNSSIGEEESVVSTYDDDESDSLDQSKGSDNSEVADLSKLLTQISSSDDVESSSDIINQTKEDIPSNFEEEEVNEEVNVTTPVEEEDSFQKLSTHKEQKKLSQDNVEVVFEVVEDIIDVDSRNNSSLSFHEQGRARGLPFNLS